MLKLGHITYSNCFPPHAGIVTGRTPFPFGLIEGIPTELNRLLQQGTIDVSPSSSIEFAMNPGRYLILPDFSITSPQEVRSIILQSRVPIAELSGRIVGLTTASATSVVLLKVLLSLQFKVRPVYTTFEQGKEQPFGKVDAMLFIGDLALKSKATAEYPYLFDLGALWHDFTGLPFVFALWQINYKKQLDKDLALLYDVLVESREYGLSNVPALANAHASRFDLPVQLLMDYWNSFSYFLGEKEKKGLLAFYGYAAEIGAIDAVKELHIWQK